MIEQPIGDNAGDSIGDNEVRQNPQDFVDAFVHDLLTDRQKQIVRQWIEADPANKLLVDEATRMKSELESAPDEPLDESLIKNTLGKVEEKSVRKRRFWRRYWTAVSVATAASILALIGLQVYYSQLTPPDFDLQVRGQSQVLSDSDGMLNVAVLRNSSGELLDGVPVEIRLIGESETLTLASFQTGEVLPAIQWPDWSGKFNLEVVAKPDGKVQKIQRTVRLERSFQVMLTTDKPLYQPGQTIHIRSLSLRKPDLKPVSDSNAIFRVFDPKGNTVFKKTTTTSEFGICSADFVLADEINEGMYRVACQIGDTTSEQSVKVSHYVLPKFKVAIEIDQRFHKPGDEVSGTISADYFFGKPVVGGKIEFWNQVAGIAADIDFPNDAVTDEEGKYQIKFKLPSTMVNRGDGRADVNLLVQVTDPADQQVATSKRIVVTAQPIQIEVIPESPRLLPGVTNRVYIYTAYPDGRPANSTVTVNGQELQTDSMGVAEIMVDAKSAKLDWLVKAEDKEGLVGRRRVALNSIETGEAILLRTDKAVYQSGDSIEIEAIGSGVQPVFVDMIQNQQTVLTKTLKMEAGSASTVIDLPPEVFGLLRIEAYRIRNDSPVTRSTRLIQVEKVSELRITTEIDNQNPKPGDTANVQFRVTDADGNPAPAALGIVAVDEAVYSVANLPFGLESTYFTLEKEFMQPVYAIYGEWHARHFDGDREPRDRGKKIEPEFVQNESRTSRFEQAMLARAGNAASDWNAFNAISNPFFERQDDVDDEKAANPIRSARFSNAHSLTGETFPTIEREYDRNRRAGLRFVNRSWFWLGLTFFLCLVIAFAIAWPKIFAIAALAMLPLAGCFLCVLPLQDAAMKVTDSAREEAAKSAGSERPGMAAYGAERESESADTKAPPRIRRDFPETLVWRPQLITDDNGVVTLPVQLADSITNWKMSYSAVSSGGKLGSGQSDITVFQPFFVDIDAPVELVRGDQVKLPIVVYNYLDEAQTISLEIENNGWFADWKLDDTVDNAVKEAIDGANEEAVDEADPQPVRMTLEIEPGQVKSVFLPVRARKVGSHELKITATSGDAGDAIVKSIRVVPDGRLVEVTNSGSLSKTLNAEFSIPENAIPGSEKLLVRIQPGTFNQLVDGLDSIFKLPQGCFEQTSSATYPNVMALQYLSEHELAAPDVEMKAREYINLGYQRLLSFEIDGGGFDWYGNPPANVALTAYGLQEFVDMARVHDVDPALITRTRRWLMSKRGADGSWAADERHFDGIGNAVDPEHARLILTAYVTWSVFADDQAADAKRTVDWLLSHPASTLNDSYTIALVANALLAADKNDANVEPYLDRLLELKLSGEENSLIWWEQQESTMMFSRGKSAAIEATSLAALAFLKAEQHLNKVPAILNWLMQAKDSRGGWQSTQATILALKALIAGSGTPTALKSDSLITINIDDELNRELEIAGDQSDVTQLIDLSDGVKEKAGDQISFSLNAKLEDGGDTSSMCGQVVLQYHVPGVEVDAKSPLDIRVDYNTKSLQVDELVTATVKIQNNMNRSAPMVMLDLPIPAGFDPLRADFEKMIDDGKIAKFEFTSRQIIVYIRNLPGDFRKDAAVEKDGDSSRLELQYRLRATMPVKVTVPDAKVYEYYNPENQSQSGRTRLEVTELS